VITFEVDGGQVIAIDIYPLQIQANQKAAVRKPILATTEAQNLLSACTNGHKFSSKKVAQTKRGEVERRNFDYTDSKFGILCGSQGNLAHLSYDKRGQLVSANFITGIRYLGNPKTKSMSLISVAREQFASTEMSVFGPIWIRDFKKKDSHLSFGYKRGKRTIFVSTATRKVISESVDPN
jgi:hypothetical protein